MKDESEQVSTICGSWRVWRITRPLLQAVLTSSALFIAFLTAGAFADVTAGQSHAPRHRTKKGSICGKPMVACKTSVTFQPNDLPFRVPANSVIVDTELFYAIILKSVATREDE